MMKAVVDVIGALVGVVDIGVTIPGLLPGKDEQRTFVRVAARLWSNERDTTSGK